MDAAGRPPTDARPPAGASTPKLLKVTSTSFVPGERIPLDHVRDGKNRSPALSWEGAPAGARSFAVICDDPDAPQAEPFVHWLVYEIPAGAMGLALTSLPEGIDKAEHPHGLPGAIQGTNDFGAIGYDGPQPPKGHGTHHYHFKVYALDDFLSLPAGTRKAKLVRAMEGHILASGELVGTYSR